MNILVFDKYITHILSSSSSLAPPFFSCFRQFAIFTEWKYVVCCCFLLTQLLGLTCFFCFGVVVMVAARCLGAAMLIMMKSGVTFGGKRGSQFDQTSLFGCVVKT